MYDLRTFQNITSVGGNDSARGTDEELFEDKYDQLISLVKTSSPKSMAYICKITPRGDTNVTSFNSCIERLALHWQKHDVICINNTNYSYGIKRVPTTRFFSKDGIHLSWSGIKRLLDAISTVINIVDNYDCCVFMRLNRRTGYRGKNFGASNQRQAQFQRNTGPAYSSSQNAGNRRSKRRCFGCGITGHIYAECWNT